jgi:hypothetical protein
VTTCRVRAAGATVAAPAIPLRERRSRGYHQQSNQAQHNLVHWIFSCLKLVSKPSHWQRRHRPRQKNVGRGFALDQKNSKAKIKSR